MVKNLPANAGDLRGVDSIPGWRRSPGEGHGNPLKYSCLENPIDREAWQATVYGSAQSGHDRGDLLRHGTGLISNVGGTGKGIRTYLSGLSGAIARVLY